MTGEQHQRRTVTITSPHGLHMRPAQAFVALVNQYQCEVSVCKGEQRVSGKSILGLVGLYAPQGTKLILEVSGLDADAAIEPLAEALVRVFPDE
jgi:phosphocarrier protein HPr